MTRILLVTAREYRRTIGAPAFWIIALVIPLIVAAAPLAVRLFRPVRTVGYVLVDQSGHYAERMKQRVELEYQRQVLMALLAYAQEWRAAGAAPGPEAVPEAARATSDAMVHNFIAAGGAETTLRLLKSGLRSSAPPFQLPPRPLTEVPLPAGIATDSAERFGALIAPRLQQPALGVAIFIPRRVDAGDPVRVWMDGTAGAALIQDLRLELTEGARLAALRARGLDPLSAAQIEGLRAHIAITPHTATGRGQTTVPSALPLALAYLLLVSMVMTGSMMLQGLIEERSNKLLEAVLACVSPSELMAGKLLGISAIGLSIIGLWIGLIVGIVSVQPSSPLGFIVPALASLSRSPGMLLVMAFYFLAGYLTLGMVFLAVGAVSDSMQQAQAYLTPLMLVIATPLAVMGTLLARDPNGLVAHVVSWIPLYTPVVMLARLQRGVSGFEIAGTSLLLLAFGALEIALLNRIFAHHLIKTGEPRRMPIPNRAVLIAVVIVATLAIRLSVRHRAPATTPAATAADPTPCTTTSPWTTEGTGWNGWGLDPENSRFQSRPGLLAADIPRLRVKWAFNYVGGRFGQPTVVGGRLLLTSMSGVYSLDAKTGCVVWRFAQPVASRTTVVVGPAPGVAPSGTAAYFGDLSANVYAVDAASGALLWKTRVDPHPRAVLTGSPTLWNNRLYVPVSSWEEGTAAAGQYSCCTFRGSVVALDAATGQMRWQAFAITRASAPTGRNRSGTQMYGPAGAAVWSAPTIDAKRRRLYFTTGNSYTDIGDDGSDAVIAVDLVSGQIVWRTQMLHGDNSLSFCSRGRPLPNCPTTLGHDYDFGASPILMTLPNGEDVVIAGQKSGTVFGLDPATGAIRWSTPVGVGGFLGGIEWGMATDSTRLYVANADAITTETGRPGLFALDPATGKDLWYAPSFAAQSAAPSVIPGVIFAGSTDGHERAYAAADGRVLWDFDTHQTIDVSSGTIAGGMLFVMSGYVGVLGGSARDVLLAFSVDGR